MKKYVLILTLVLGCVAAVTIPYTTTLVPVWRIRVVDENGVPYKSHLVRQMCYDYTLDISPCSTSVDADQLTDGDGYVEFPERTIRASLIYRIFATLKTAALILAHGSVGKDIYIDSTGPSGYQTLPYEPAVGRPPDTLVLPSGDLVK